MMPTGHQSEIRNKAVSPSPYRRGFFDDAGRAKVIYDLAIYDVRFECYVSFDDARR